MKEYTRLIKIRYNKKDFVVFSDSNHRKAFLEVRTKEEKEIYYYPILSDYIYLNNIYNGKDDGILYNSKNNDKQTIKFKEKVIIAGGAIYITCMLTYFALGIVNISSLPSTKLYLSTRFTKSIEKEENYYNIGKAYIIKNNEALTEFGISHKSFAEVREALANNKNISDYYRVYVEDFIDRLEVRLPDIDLRIFYENIVNLKIEAQPDVFFENNTDANFDWTTTTINLKKHYRIKNYPAGARERICIFHELVHSLNNAMFSKNGRLIIKNFYISSYAFHFSNYYSEDYGQGYNEGFTTILTDYLLTDHFEQYFAKESSWNYPSYDNIASFSYEVLNLLKNEFTIYDFLNKNIYYLEELLEKIDLEDSVDFFDSLFLSSSAENIEIIEADFHVFTTRIFKEKIRNYIEKGYTEMELLLFFNREMYTNSILNPTWEDYNEIMEKFNFTQNIKVTSISEEQLKINKCGTITVIKEGVEIISNASISEINVEEYKGEEKYRLIVRNPELPGSMIVAKTGEIINNEDLGYYTNINIFLNKYSTLGNVSFVINNDLLQTPEFQSFMRQSKRDEVGSISAEDLETLERLKIEYADSDSELKK